MGLFGRRRGRRDANVEHLERFVATRSGVEAYLEPRTNVTPATVILIAADGEWTRRPLLPRDAFALGNRLALPVYEVARLGYPQRMRDWNAAQRVQRAPR